MSRETCVHNHLLPPRRAGRLRPLGALSRAGVRVSLQPQTERGHGGRHLPQVAGAQVSSKVISGLKIIAITPVSPPVLPKTVKRGRPSGCRFIRPCLFFSQKGTTVHESKLFSRKWSRSAAAFVLQPSPFYAGPLNFTLPLLFFLLCLCFSPTGLYGGLRD